MVNLSSSRFLAVNMSVHLLHRSSHMSPLSPYLSHSLGKGPSHRPSCGDAHNRAPRHPSQPPPSTLSFLIRLFYGKPIHWCVGVASPQSLGGRGGLWGGISLSFTEVVPGNGKQVTFASSPPGSHHLGQVDAHRQSPTSQVWDCGWWIPLLLRTKSPLLCTTSLISYDHGGLGYDFAGPAKFKYHRVHKIRWFTLYSFTVNMFKDININSIF